MPRVSEKTTHKWLFSVSISTKTPFFIFKYNLHGLVDSISIFDQSLFSFFLLLPFATPTDTLSVCVQCVSYLCINWVFVLFLSLSNSFFLHPICWWWLCVCFFFVSSFGFFVVTKFSLPVSNLQYHFTNNIRISRRQGFIFKFCGCYKSIRGPCICWFFLFHYYLFWFVCKRGLIPRLPFIYLLFYLIDVIRYIR